MVRSAKWQGRTLRGGLQSVTEPEVGPAAIVTQHGYALYLLANVLTADSLHAERLVVQAITAQGDNPCDFRSLASAVHVAWSAWGAPSEAVAQPLPTAISPSAQVLHELHGLPEDQRAAIALCKYGGHTYRQAADALGIPGPDLAVLLGQALHALASPRERGADPSPPSLAVS